MHYQKDALLDEKILNRAGEAKQSHSELKSRD